MIAKDDKNGHAYFVGKYADLRMGAGSVGWRQVRTIAWFMYGYPSAFIDHVYEMRKLIINATP